MLNRLVLCAVLFGALSCASKEHARVPPATSVVSETADERLDPLSCAGIKPALADSFGNALDLRFSPTMLDASRSGWSEDDIVALARMLVVKPGILTRVWNYYGPGSGSITGFPFSFTSHGKT